jgi:hypothetical protein
VEAGTEGDGFVHVRYSRFSDVRVIVWAAPVGVTLRDQSGVFSLYPEIKQLSYVEKYTHLFDTLSYMCIRCPTCQRYKREATLQEGALLNAWMMNCLDHTLSKGPTMYACHFLVCLIVFLIFLDFFFSGW